MRVPGVGGPRGVLACALAALADGVFKIVDVSPVIDSAPVGPSQRRYANAVAVVVTALDPPAVLERLQRIERTFGRRRRGQRWRARPLDLDIVLWSGGTWVSDGLVVPHKSFRLRDFVLRPAVAIAAHWRDPGSGLTLRHLHTRLTRPRPLPR